jgi:hypothetical protein
MDIIEEISGISSHSRHSAKLAAQEIANQGQELYDIVFERALLFEGVLSERCAEACARAAAIYPALTQNKADKLTDAITNNPSGNIRYFLSAILAHTNVDKNAAKRNVHVIKKWLDEEKGLGARACYLEAIAKLSTVNPKLKPLAQSLLNEALKSPVPSYSARARVIISGKRK